MSDRQAGFSSFLLGVVAALLSLPAAPETLWATGPGLEATPATASVDRSQCIVFRLERRSDGEIQLAPDTVPAGQLKVFMRDPGSDLIDVVLPVGPGRSGNVATVGDGRRFILRCESDQVRLSYQDPEGETVSRPARPLEELESLDVRVSVIGGDGTKAAFLIQTQSHVVPDSTGPAMDPFGDRVELDPADFVIFTETFAHRSGPPAMGQAALTDDGHLRVDAALGGRDFSLFLDLAASGATIVDRRYLPESVSVETANRVEYSGAARRLLDYAPGGAGGSVENVEGLALVPELRVGSIVFSDVPVLVLSSLPEWFPAEVRGILGLDLLRRAPSLRLELPVAGEREGRLVMGQAPRPDAPVQERMLDIPCSLATHIFIRARVEGEVVHFVLDTGAPTSFLDGTAMQRLGLEPRDTFAVRGLDDHPVEVVGASADLVVQHMSFSELSFRVGHLPVFSLVRNAGGLAGLLGLDFLRRFDQVEVIFEPCRVRLTR